MAAAEQAVEVVADVVQSAGTEVVQAADVIRSLNAVKIQYGLLGTVAGLAAGGAIGYIVAGKRLQTKYQKLAQDEIDEMAKHFRNVEIARQSQEKPPIDQVVEDLGYRAPEEGKPEPIVNIKQVNVFPPSPAEPWVYEKELEGRSPDKPYVIHKDEFDEVDREQDGAYETAMVTYYREDDVLADVRDQRIANHDSVVGLENLEKFGHGSGDANTVFIRNDREKVDFEVVLSHGSFTAEVLGQEVEPDDEGSLQHSSDMRRRKPRRSDEHGER